MHDHKRVEAIRNRVTDERPRIANLDAQLNDAGGQQMLQLASFWVNDVETLFLGSLHNEQRTPAQESLWLENAERVLQIAALQRESVDKVVAQYGPNVQTIPSPH